MVARGPYDTKSASDLVPVTLGDRIKKLRWHFGWTQEDLSRQVNTDQAIISNWERDRAKPSGAALAALAQVFQVATQALETGEGFELKPRQTDTTEGPVDLTLTPAPGAPIVLMDLQRGTERGVEFQEALSALLSGTQAGRTVWVVLR
jgi:transcriptional regulator with XRE-family HTH domain